MVDCLTVAVRLSAAAVQTNAVYRLFGAYFDRPAADREKERGLFALCFVLCALKAVLPMPPLVNAALTIGICAALSFLYPGTVPGRLARALGIVALMVLCEGLVAGCMAFLPVSPHTAWVTGSMLSQLLLLVLALVLQRVHTPRISAQISRLYWLAILCLPAGSLLIYFLVISAFYNPAGDRIFLPVSSVLLLINLLTFYVLDRLEEYSAACYETELLARQNRAYQVQFGLMRQSERQVSALRHDMKNHLAVLREYAARGQTEELARYLDICLEKLACPGLVHTGNPDVDSILNYKLGQAVRAGARLELDVNLPEGFTVEAFDWNVIIGNLLDNAVEALERREEKRLSLSLRADRGVLTLKIANSCDGPACCSRKSGEGRGLGLPIVRRTVDKYHGELRVDGAGTVFTVEVVLPLEPLAGRAGDNEGGDT